MSALKKRDEFLPLTRPAFGAEEIDAVVECLKSGWITSGPRAKEFEERFAESVNAPHAIAVSSGTAGLHLVLHDMGIGEGDEVVTSPMTFATTVNMIALSGAKPVFVDIDYDDLMMKPELVEPAMTDKTRAVIPIHMAGAACDLEPVEDAARRKGVPVIEDAAHALGTLYKDKPVGARPQTAIFSLQAIKNMTTAEGGIITCHDADQAERLRRLRFHGIQRLAWDRYAKGGKPHYDITEPGYKYNYPDIFAAIGLVQLKRLSGINERRRKIAEAYLEELEGLEGLDLPPRRKPDEGQSWHLFIVKVKDMERDEFMLRLQEYNVGTGLHFPACHLLSYVRERYGYKKGDFPKCELAAERIVSLPLFPDMTLEDVHYVCEVIRGIFKS